MVARRHNEKGTVLVVCPRCGNEGEVPRDATGQIWGCTACRKWVYVDRNGRAYAQLHEPDTAAVSLTLRVRCPRCGGSSRVSPLQLRGLLRCARCGEKLWVAPDGRLLAGREALFHYRRATGQSRSPVADPPRGRTSAPRAVKLPRWLMPAAAAVPLLVAAYLALAARPGGDGTSGAEDIAARFVKALLAGDRRRAELLLLPETDAARFDAWWRLNRATLEAAFGQIAQGEVVNVWVEGGTSGAATAHVVVRIRSREMQFVVIVKRAGGRWFVTFAEHEGQSKHAGNGSCLPVASLSLKGSCGELVCVA